MKKRMMALWICLLVIISTVGAPFTPVFATTTEEVVETTPSGIPLNELESAIDEYVADYIGKTVPGAAIAVVKDGEIIFSKGYGYRDEGSKLPVDSESTIFEWGSITKIFTWTAVMQLVEEGILDLDQDISVYLPEEFLNEWHYEQFITMRNLMNHTAGFGDYGFDLIYETPDGISPLEEELLKSNPEQYFEVGSASAYSNYGTALAGYVIENLTGMTYDAYLRENFYDVLDMKSTSADRRFNVSNEMKERKSKGYKPNGQTGYTETIWSYVGLGPAGSLNGTVEDLARFAIALTPGKEEATPIFENRETLDLLQTPTYMMTANGYFEFDGEYQSFGHGGNTAGFTGQFAIVPEERFGVVTLTNLKGEINIGYGIQEMLIGKKEYVTKNESTDLPMATEVEGTYLSYRRFEGSFLEALSYMAPMTVKASGLNEVKVNLSGLEQTYVQTEPYVYKITGRDTPLFNMAFPILSFEMENGVVKQLTTGHGFDLSPIPVEKSTAIQLGSLMIVVLNVILLIVGIVALIILAVRNRKAQNLNQMKLKAIHGGSILIAAVALANNTVCLGSFIISSFKTFESLKGHILVNYGLLIGFAFLGVYAYKNWSTEEAQRPYRYLVSTSLLALMGLFIVLNHWRFFVIY